MVNRVYAIYTIWILDYMVLVSIKPYFSTILPTTITLEIGPGYNIWCRLVLNLGWQPHVRLGYKILSAGMRIEFLYKFYHMFSHAYDREVPPAEIFFFVFDYFSVEVLTGTRILSRHVILISL